jgi:hypothetical protein
MLEPKFRVNSAQIAYELIDGEVVVIHLRHGSYHNLSSSAAWLWAELLQGATVTQLQALLATLPGAPAAEVAAAVTAEFLATLQAADLIHPGGAESGLAAPFTVPVPTHYQVPLVETYTDMQALLLLDPVHEVDAAGWPKRTDTAVE